MNKKSKRNQVTTKNLESVKRMPPLRHTIPGKEFSINNSEVASWFLQQDGVKQFVFSKISDYGLIKYNPDKGTWQGVDYNND